MRDLADDVHHGLLTGLPVAFFNPVWVPYASPDLEDDLGDLVDTGQQRGIPMRVAVPEGSDHESQVEAVSTARGLEPVDARGPGMALDDLTALAGSFTSGFRPRTVAAVMVPPRPGRHRVDRTHVAVQPFAPVRHRQRGAPRRQPPPAGVSSSPAAASRVRSSTSHRPSWRTIVSST